MWTRPEMQWKVSAGFWLVLGVLFYLDEGVGLLPWGLLACVVHELGHVAAASWLGGQLRQLRLTAVGAEMWVTYPRAISYGEDTAVALAGPVANGLLSALAFGAGLHILGVLSLGVGGFNLMPVAPLDGARVLHNYLAPLLGPQQAQRWETTISAVLVGGLVGLGAVVMGRCANLTLLLTSVWLLWGMIRRETLVWWQESCSSCFPPSRCLKKS